MAIKEEKNPGLLTDSESCAVDASQDSERASFLIPDVLDGQRLDYALKVAFPDAGLRLRRRYCESGRIRLAGKRGKPAVKVRAGQLVEWIADREKPTSTPEQEGGAAVLLCQNAGLAALFKPAGMYSAAIAGRDAPSLEALLPTLLSPMTSYHPRLLNRLDYTTSGLVMAACSEAGERLWRQSEQTGRTVKTYLALIEGHPLHDFTVKRKLDTAHRIRSRVLHMDDPDSFRHTQVTLLQQLTGADIPSSFLSEFSSREEKETGESCLGRTHHFGVSAAFPLTLVRCRIYRGARHQIRAHLAAAGHPLLGDALYGATLSNDSNRFFLHHGHIALPGFYASCPPPWIDLLPQDLAALYGNPLVLKS